MLTISACLPDDRLITPTNSPPPSFPTPTSLAATPLPTRPAYRPGELVDYIAQTGDNLPALAARFNTTVRQIRDANPIIPEDATTMPHGMPMKIPIYYQPLWGSPYQIIPDSLFINGPEQIGFDPVKYVNQHPGWLKNKVEYLADKNRRGGEIIEYYATYYSISPRLLLALLEYQTGALSNPLQENPDNPYILGYRDTLRQGLANQLIWAANTLNNGYYSWRSGKLKSIELKNRQIEVIDPWQNASTAALRRYFSLVYESDQFHKAVSSEGLAKTYRILFGDPWLKVNPHIPVSLEQPPMRLPFDPGKTWAFTGGPHTGWGDGEPWAALDFAPPSVIGGCSPTKEWATAVADGLIVRTGSGIAVLDLDGDGDERTGWVVFYLHLASEGMVPLGTRVKTGDPMGHPSCEGGRSTGTHVHIARKYNGEWILADGVLAFDLEGWKAKNGKEAYEGSLEKNGITVIAGRDQKSHIQSILD